MSNNKKSRKNDVLSVDADGEVETSQDTLVEDGKSLIDALDDLGFVKQPAGFGKTLALSGVGATGVGV